ncbi:MAG TPA: lipopolysaccharide assembly protein LapB [Gammaproteobacteria bacterium]|jgi:lipopolysaccharide biosynthesis regulator YciM
MDTAWLMLVAMLLPVAAISGWWVARRAAGRTAGGRSLLHPDYFRGLNFVLNEQPDKAIEVFVKMLEVDSETVETHLALGNLFRRRGEVDRAIRIHQNLIARPSLSRDYRSMALLELGMDYMRSGLLDRAEGLFKELVEIGAHTHAALQQLLIIYQQERDWDSAIHAARRLGSASGERLEPMIAQFYCEQAGEHLAAGRDKEGRDCLRRALNTDPKCVRASLIEAQLAQDAGRTKAAIKAYRRTELQDPEYLPDVIAPLCRCYRELGQLDEFMKYLREMIDRHGGITPLLFLTDLIAEREGEAAAIKFISAELRRRPTVRGVNRLVEYAMNKASGEALEDLRTIRELTSSLIEDRPIYRCNRCGFDAKRLHWQCPSCKNWNTVKPVHGVEGE